MRIQRTQTTRPRTTGQDAVKPAPARGGATKLAKAPTKPASKAGKATKYVYFFGAGGSDGDATMRNLLGGKGSNLAEMAGLGLPVPPGFTISTEVCTHYNDHGRKYPASLRAEVAASLAKVEKAVGRRFGDAKNPLLVSVRSGARVSMPGMMDTVLNLGLNDRTVEGLIAMSGSARFAYDSYRRFVQMYGDVVLGMKPESKDEHDPFEELLDKKKKQRGVKQDTDLTAEDLKDLVQQFKATILARTGIHFPEDPQEQLWGAISAVFGSWNNDRAIVYRKLNDIPESWGTAVNVQTMVFGNLGEDSGTGVAFTRDPSTGANVFYGEFLMNAQGEDVVAGIRTPLEISALKKIDPKSFKQLLDIRQTLEKHYRDMQDVEFTIEAGRLYMLQCRVGKRTGAAAIRIALDMVTEKLISWKDGLLRVKPDQLNQILRPTFVQKDKTAAVVIAKGLNAGPGAATGRIAFHADDAEMMAKKGEDVILVRIETSPEDIRGMAAAQGILTARGGMTSHAALVARQMGKVCVAGCEALQIDYRKRVMKVEVGGKTITLKEGDYVSIDGTTGEVFQGQIRTEPSEVVRVLVDKSLKPAKAPLYQQYAELMTWADKARRMRVRANADQPDQCANSIAFGAEGVGLCRTEHMFFGEGKIEPMREMILAETADERRNALAKLLPLQRKDFFEIFKVMHGLPVTIRLIDPPLHEFLPHDAKGQAEIAKQMGIPAARIRERIEALHEFNPMLGFRGCRLGLMYPEITEMQARAIFEGAVRAIKAGKNAIPEVMIPLVGHVKELELQAQLVHAVARTVMTETGVKFSYSVGTMIEVPRGAITADEIAGIAEFFSFGTNDLTQTTLGVSRDDAARFLGPYVTDLEIYARDPFETIDQGGVGELMRMAVAKGRSTKRNLKLGICGEHGGDPASVIFCDELGLDYVSCSPFRIPIARLAAAHAALQGK
jgi:pyruvate,orthophosphate dikinase